MLLTKHRILRFSNGFFRNAPSGINMFLTGLRSRESLQIRRWAKMPQTAPPTFANFLTAPLSPEPGQAGLLRWVSLMALQNLRLGYLFSSTGSYELVARSMLNGALLAAEEINASGLGIRLEPSVLNPGGNLSQYSALAAKLLKREIRHVVGCYTSSSRKEVIPLFEKHDALLWYPSHYEGFESSTNVIYTGAAPNQHVLPLVEYLIQYHGHRAFCVGSNYIWAWENNRILRESVMARGGSVLAERYFAIGETDFHQAIEAIIAARPSFVFLTLIGTSAYQFFRDFRAACRARGIDQAREIPVASCSLSEPELQAIGEDAVDGHLSC